MRMGDGSVSRRVPVGVALALAASAPHASCAKPNLNNPHQESLAYLAPYAAHLARTCPEHDLEISFVGFTRRQLVSDGDQVYPFRLASCGHDVTFSMFCWGRCFAEEWPVPAGLATHRFEDGLVEELIVVLQQAPRCEPADACCARRGFRIRRLEVSPDASRYEVERCGRSRRVAVRCERPDRVRCRAAPD
jgi:hypothetical protein